MARRSEISCGDSWSCLKFLLLAVLISNVQLRISAQLDMNYYVTSCPNVEAMVQGWLTANVFTDPTGPAALVRMAFHDCLAKPFTLVAIHLIQLMLNQMNTNKSAGQ
jgi:hypothetical protein